MKATMKAVDQIIGREDCARGRVPLGLRIQVKAFDVPRFGFARI